MTETDPDVLQIDLDHLTVGEIEEIEELSGMAIDQLAQAGTPKGKLMRAVGLVTRRRTEPGFTWEQAGKLKIKLQEGAVPPTGGDG